MVARAASETVNGEGRRTARVTQTVTASDAAGVRGRGEGTAGRPRRGALAADTGAVGRRRQEGAPTRPGVDDHFALLTHFAALPAVGEGRRAPRRHREARRPASPACSGCGPSSSRPAAAARNCGSGCSPRRPKWSRCPPAATGWRWPTSSSNQAPSALAANELLELPTRLAPGLRRPADAHAASRRKWRQNRVHALRNAGKPEEALALEKRAGRRVPARLHGAGAVRPGAVQPRRPRGRLRVRRRSNSRDTGWSGMEEESLRSVHADWLEQLGRLPGADRVLGRLGEATTRVRRRRTPATCRR